MTKTAEPDLSELDEFVSGRASCRVADILAQMDERDQAILEATIREVRKPVAFRRRNKDGEPYNAAQVTRWVNGKGFKVSESTMRFHVRKDCPCD